MRCKAKRQFVPTTFTQMSIRAAGASPLDHFVVWQADAELSNAKVLGADLILRAAFAARPAAGLAGRLFYATDTGNLFRDNGAAWEVYAAAGFVGAGAMIYGGADLVSYASLAIGAAKRVLRSDGSVPTWSNQVALLDADATQTVQGTGDNVELRIAPHTDGQGGNQLNCVNAAGTITWFSVNGSGKIRVGLGVAQDGGVKHARVAYGAIAAGVTFRSTFTWPNAFADANYTCIATAEDTLDVFAHTQSKLAASIDISVHNFSGAGTAGGTVHLIAFHD